MEGTSCVEAWVGVEVSVCAEQALIKTRISKTFMYFIVTV